MEIESLQEALGDETFSELKNYIDELEGKVTQARNESIKGRKGKDAKIAELETAQADLLERLGIESVADVEDLPDVAGMADAQKQVEAKVKRLERLLGESEKALEGERTARRGQKMEAEVSKALAAHEFNAADIVSAHVQQSLVWEGDDLLFKTADGNLVSVADGVAGVAKARPELLKSTGAGGAGIRSNNARGSEGQLSMTRAEFEALSPTKQMEVSKSGVDLH